MMENVIDLVEKFINVTQLEEQWNATSAVDPIPNQPPSMYQVLLGKIDKLNNSITVLKSCVNPELRENIKLLNAKIGGHLTFTVCFFLLYSVISLFFLF